MHRQPTRLIRLLAAFVLCVLPAAAMAEVEGIEVKSVRIARTYGWLPLGADRLIVWLGVEEPYLLDLPPGCTDLGRETVTGLTSHRRRLQVRTDAVMTTAARCPILAMRRADARELASAGIGLSAARPLPVISTNPAVKPR